MEQTQDDPKQELTNLRTESEALFSELNTLLAEEIRLSGEITPLSNFLKAYSVQALEDAEKMVVERLDKEKALEGVRNKINLNWKRQVEILQRMQQLR